MRLDKHKGFGFIRPIDGGKDVFVHISALPSGQLPDLGTSLIFSAIDDPHGRGQRALKAVMADDPVRAPSPRPMIDDSRSSSGVDRTRARSSANSRTRRSTEPRERNRGAGGQTTLRALPLTAQSALVGILALVCLAGALTLFPHTPIPLFAYPVASLAAFLLYARDKLSAIRGIWRVPESTLHLLELAGGWPGAYIAQQTMRHKTVKTTYQATYWGIVCLHLAFWGLWFVSPETLIDQILPLMESFWRG